MLVTLAAVPRRFRPLLLAAGTCVAWLPASVHAETVPTGADNPHYKQAQQDLDNNDANGAADEYEAALVADPKLVQAHYELGVLYAEKLSEPISALYHLDRYLKLAPSGPNAPAARDLFNTESEAFAASIPGNSSTAVLARLELENAVLKKQAGDAAHTIGTLQSQLAQASARVVNTPEPAAGPGPAPAPNGIGPTPAHVVVAGITPGSTNALASPAVPDPTSARTYTVVKRDTIWTIAKRMYPGHTKEGVDAITEANQEQIGKKPLKIGQVLIIPPL
jgi:nucleoid-associated protein YgaU